MYHIKQNDIRCRKEIREYGCFYRSCGLVAEYHTGKCLNARQLNEGWDECKKNNWIDADDDIVNSAAIINYFLNELGDSGKYIEVGTFTNGVKTFYDGVNPKYRKIDALIQKVKTNGKYGTHFRPVDKKGALVEDPHEPVIEFESVMYSILYCYIGVKKNENVNF